jgi:hypothetical protein
MDNGVSATMPELPEQARCPSCGYCLRGSTVPRCPECGRSFDPFAVLNSLAPRRPRLLNARERWLLRPPGKREWFLAVLAMSLLVWINTDFDDPISIGPNSTWFAAPPALAILILASLDLARVAVIFTTRDLPDELRQWRLRRRISLIATLTGFLLVSFFPWEPDIRFWLSKPALDSLAKQVMTKGRGQPDHWVGLYHARYISRITNGMNFRLGNWNDGHGLEFISPGSQPLRPVQYQHLGGQWYAFFQ